MKEYVWDTEKIRVHMKGEENVYIYFERPLSAYAYQYGSEHQKGKTVRLTWLDRKKGVSFEEKLEKQAKLFRKEVEKENEHYEKITEEKKRLQKIEVELERKLNDILKSME